jgi:uncharacterized protein
MMRSIRETVSDFTPGFKIAFLVFACMVSWLLVTLILLSVIPLFFGITYGQIPALLSDTENSGSRRLLMFMQGGSSLGLFAGGAILYGYFAEQRHSVWYNWTAKNTVYHLVVIAIGIMALLSFLPVADLLERLNSGIVFPDFLSGIGDTLRLRQEALSRQLEALLHIETTADFITAAIVLALIPAIGEEWIFRAKLQGLIQRFTGSAHGGIWITSLIFALFHQQFFVLFPMMFLALFLGYLYAFTRSLWVSVSVHFTNNFTSLLVYIQGGDLSATPDIPLTVYIISGMCVAGALTLLVFYRKRLDIH